MRSLLVLLWCSLLSLAAGQADVDKVIEDIFSKPTTDNTDDKNVDAIIDGLFEKPGTDNRNPPIDLTPTTSSSVPGTGTCECVPYYLCNNNTIIKDGFGVIDIR